LPDAVRTLLKREGVPGNERQGRLLDPLAMIRLVSAGRFSDAVAVARTLAVGAQLRTPFSADSARSGCGNLCAALLFPISDPSFAMLTDRAYPDLSKDQEGLQL
jgi:hypothetical protein